MIYTNNISQKEYRKHGTSIIYNNYLIIALTNIISIYALDIKSQYPKSVF